MTGPDHGKGDTIGYIIGIEEYLRVVLFVATTVELLWACLCSIILLASWATDG